MKLLAFLGSPRSNGNTDTLTHRVLDGARVAGLETKLIELRSLDIQPCIGCDRCWKTDKPCIFSDDMIGLYDEISSADALLFATPVYWYGPTTLMKTFMDRFVVFNRPRGRPLIEGKAALVVTAYEEDGPEAVEPLLKMFELSFKYLGMRFVEKLVVDGTGPKGSILLKPEALTRAADIGRSLPKLIAN
jgi:multimeric flavodoxin WrbA